MGLRDRLRGALRVGANDQSPDFGAPGWSAIDDALRGVYGDVEPKHWGTIVRWRLGGPDPLDGTSAFLADRPPPHWHYVTYGLSELYNKESDDLEWSGYGIELTFRLSRPTGAIDPPIWPANLLQNLARYVFDTGNVLGPNHHMDLNGPIETDADTRIRAAAFTRDPELPTIHTPNGQVTFIQVVGITLDELKAMVDWDTVGVLGALRVSNPLLVTDLTRESLLLDPAAAEVIHRGIEEEGSALDGTNTDRLAWEERAGVLMLTLGAVAVPTFASMLHGRVRLGRPFFLRGEGRRLTMAPGTALSWDWAADDENDLSIHLTPDQADRLGRLLRAEAGVYVTDELPGLEVHVERTLIRDQAGEVTERVG